MRKVSLLSPRKRKFYEINKYQRGRISKLNKLLSEKISKLSTLNKLTNTAFFQTFNNAFNPACVSFLESQIVNATRKKPLYNKANKAFALAIYKRGPCCYKFLQKFFKLPSKTTLTKYLRLIPFNTGLNPILLEKLANRIR